jgi:hypothetical protein
MLDGTHCWKHDIWYPPLGECPRCLAEESAELQREHFERQEEARHIAEERYQEARDREEREYEEAREREEEGQRDQERRHEELVRLRELEIYKRNNPGDYQCPECLLISLVRGAMRCPLCHAVVGQGYWPPIYEKEELQAEEKARREKAAEEEWKRTEPERRAKAAAAAADVCQKRERGAFLCYLHLIWAVPVCWFAAGIAGLIVGGIIGAFMEGSTAASGSNVGAAIGGVAGVLFVFIVVVVEARAKLSAGKASLRMPDAIAIAIATVVAVLVTITSVSSKHKPSSPATPPLQAQRAAPKSSAHPRRPGQSFTVIAPVDRWSEDVVINPSHPSMAYKYNDKVKMLTSEGRTFDMDPRVVGNLEFGHPTWLKFQSRTESPIPITITFIP